MDRGAGISFVEWRKKGQRHGDVGALGKIMVRYSKVSGALIRDALEAHRLSLVKDSFIMDSGSSHARSAVEVQS